MDLFSRQLFIARETSLGSGIPAGDIWRVPSSTSGARFNSKSAVARLDAWRRTQEHKEVHGFLSLEFQMQAQQSGFMAWILEQFSFSVNTLDESGREVREFEELNDIPSFVCWIGDREGDSMKFSGVVFKELDFMVRRRAVGNFRVKAYALQSIDFQATPEPTNEGSGGLIAPPSCKAELVEVLGSQDNPEFLNRATEVQIIIKVPCKPCAYGIDGRPRDYTTTGESSIVGQFLTHQKPPLAQHFIRGESTVFIQIGDECVFFLPRAQFLIQKKSGGAYDSEIFQIPFKALKALARSPLEIRI